MKTLKRKLKKLLYKLGQILINLGRPDLPFGDKVRATKEEYTQLAKEASRKRYKDIEKLEKQNGFSIDPEWIDGLALHTQIVKKKSTLNYAHGRLLYSSLCAYIKDNKNQIYGNKLNILETGTARGFSALCMAKALEDCNTYGSIITFDLIPNERKMYWNCIDDNDEKKTRLELLEKWKSLVSKYLIFVEGDSKMMLNSISLQRVNFAFLDGAHTYSDVMFEFSRIKDKQLSGDVIVYDDYNPFLFKGIVKAVDEICSLHGYSRKDVTGADGRDYVIATKM